MAKFYESLNDDLTAWIEKQHIFFVASAPLSAEGHVNLSPKGHDCLRILSPNRAAYLDLTGSGNETSAHVQLDPRMTVMFCAFDGPPLILRLYGTAKVVHKGDPEWNELFSLFNPLPGARQIFDVTIDLVQTSCGMAVPYFSHTENRELLSEWAIKKGDEGLKQYWEEKNQMSIDGIPTHIVSKCG